MKVLLIDAYDSFVHIIYQYLLELDLSVDVIRNDKITIEQIEQAQYELIIFGPGPGHPKDAGYIELIHHFQNKLPLVGVCLGMQAITMAFGGNVVKSDSIMHGKVSSIEHNQQNCFLGLNTPLDVTRYHSLIAEKKSFPNNQLEIIAECKQDNTIMAIKHKSLPIVGVQFHPESIMTHNGMKIFENLIFNNKKQIK